MKNYTKLIVFISVMILGFGIAIVYLSWPLLTGKTYILDTMPVDPFDVIRGQYIEIRYEISTINLMGDEFSSEDVGKNIYVLLEEDEEGISRFKEASFEKPDANDFIKGEIKSVGNGRVDVEYGIEQFFFERDAKFSTRGMQVEVKVDNSGQARINRLMKDGEELEIQYRNSEWWVE